MQEYSNKQIVELEPITTIRDKQGFRFYSTNNGNTLYAEKNGKIYNVSEDSLKVLGEVPRLRVKVEFIGIVNDEDVKNLYPLYYEYKTFGRVKEQVGMAEGGEIKVGDIVGNTIYGFNYKVLNIKGDYVDVINTDTNEKKTLFIESVYKQKYAEGGEIEIGDYVKIKETYGGGSGTVEDIMNNFVIVKTKEGKKSYHKSDLIKEEDENEYAKGGVIKVGDTIRIKDGLSGKLMNIEGENLEVKRITEYPTFNGLTKFYHVEYDGYEYDVREDKVEYKKMSHGGELESKKQNLLEYLNWFPYDAKSWGQATDELRDIARMARITFLEVDEKESPALDFKTLKTPTEWNTQGRFYITGIYNIMSDEAKKEFLDAFEQTFTNKMEKGGELPTITKQEWSKKLKDNKLKTKDGKYYIMKYDDKKGTYLQQVKVLEDGGMMAHGGMTAGRWYKDNTGKEFRFVGESEGKLLFKDGEKIVTKTEEDFVDNERMEKGGELNEKLNFEILPKTFKITGLKVVSTLKTLQDGWRLPTLEELKKINFNKFLKYNESFYNESFHIQEIINKNGEYNHARIEKDNSIIPFSIYPFSDRKMYSYLLPVRDKGVHKKSLKEYEQLFKNIELLHEKHNLGWGGPKKDYFFTNDLTTITNKNEYSSDEIKAAILYLSENGVKAKKDGNGIQIKAHGWVITYDFEITNTDNNTGEWLATIEESYTTNTRNMSLDEFIDEAYGFSVKKRYYEQGGEVNEDEIVEKLEEQFRGKDLWDDEILDEYEVKMFDFEEFNDEENFNKWKRSKQNKNYIVPFESNDDSYIFILVPKYKMADGGVTKPRLDCVCTKTIKFTKGLNYFEKFTYGCRETHSGDGVIVSYEDGKFTVMSKEIFNKHFEYVNKMAMGGNTEKAFEVILKNPNGGMTEKAILLAKTKEDASRKALNLKEYKQYGYVVRTLEEIKYAMGGETNNWKQGTTSKFKTRKTN